MDAEGDEPAEPEIDLYEPYEPSDFDEECGTFEASDYAPEEGTPPNRSIVRSPPPPPSLPPAQPLQHPPRKRYSLAQ